METKQTFAVEIVALGQALPIVFADVSLPDAHVIGARLNVDALLHILLEINRLLIYGELKTIQKVHWQRTANED